MNRHLAPQDGWSAAEPITLAAASSLRWIALRSTHPTYAYAEIAQSVGWVECSGTYHIGSRVIRRWVALRSTHPTYAYAEIAQSVGWVERSGTHHIGSRVIRRWVALRSTHPTMLELNRTDAPTPVFGFIHP